jgi:hypothetical protein
MYSIYLTYPLPTFYMSYQSLYHLHFPSPITSPLYSTSATSHRTESLHLVKYLHQQLTYLPKVKPSIATTNPFHTFFILNTSCFAFCVSYQSNLVFLSTYATNHSPISSSPFYLSYQSCIASSYKIIIIFKYIFNYFLFITNAFYVSYQSF